MSNAISRRAFLQLGGGAALLFVAGGSAWRAFSQGVFSLGDGPAYDAWETWNQCFKVEKDVCLAMIRASILAANPDNSQPWLFRVDGENIDLYVDPSRQLQAIDPFGRNMYIGLGCAIENLLLSAWANGYAPELELMPSENDETWGAHIPVKPGEIIISDLFWAIPERHMNRGAYDTERNISEDTLAALSSLKGGDQDIALFWINDEAKMKQTGELIVEATEATINDLDQAVDIATWTRQSWQETQEKKDGITLEAAGLSPAMLALAKMMPPISQEQNNQSWLEMTRDKHVATASAFGILAVRNKDDHSQQLRAGRLLQRLHLWATTKGIAMHIMHQLPDRAGREESLESEPYFGDALAGLIDNKDWQPLSMFRIGYPTMESLASPRRPAEEVLLK